MRWTGLRRTRGTTRFKSVATLASVLITLSLIAVSLTVHQKHVLSANDDLECASAETSRLCLPQHPRALILGDSFTYGTGATPNEAGYAYLVGSALGGATVVDGISGSGWVNSGSSGQSYNQRLDNKDFDPSMQLVVLQGGVNDQMFVDELYDQVLDSIDTTRAKYPNASLAVFGPVAGDPNDGQSVTSILAVNAVIKNACIAKSVPYIDAASNPWISSDNNGQLITADKVHPTNQGHALIAAKIIDKLEALSR